MNKFLSSLIMPMLACLPLSLFADQVQITWYEEDSNDLTYWDGQTIQTVATDVGRNLLSNGHFLWLEGNDLKLWDGNTTILIDTLVDTRLSIAMYGGKVAYRVGDDVRLYENGNTQTIFTHTGEIGGLFIAEVTEDLVVVATTTRGVFSQVSYKIWDGTQILDLNEITGSPAQWQNGLQGEGNTLVWSHRPYMGMGYIDVWDGTNHIEIKDPNISFRRPQVSESTIVFIGEILATGASEIFMWENGNLTQVTNTANDKYEPLISKGRIVWLGYDGNDYEVFTYKDGQTLQLTNNNVDDKDVTVNSGYVAWASQVDDDYEVFVWDESQTLRLTNSNAWSQSPVISVTESDTPVEASNCAITKDLVYSIQNFNSGLYMDVARASTENGANIKQYGTTVPRHRQFQSLSKGLDVFGFRGVASRLFLDVAGAHTTDGANVQQWGRDANVTHRQFTVQAGPNGACTIKAVHSGKCLGVKGASLTNNGNVEQQSCNGSPEQEWIFTEL